MGGGKAALLAALVGALLPPRFAHGGGGGGGGAAGEAGECIGDGACDLLAPEAEDEVALLQHLKERRPGHGQKEEALEPRSAAISPHVALSETAARTNASTSGSLEQPFLVNVRQAFQSLQGTGTLIGLDTGAKFPPGYSKGIMPYSEHFQGIQRQQGGQYMFITGSGITQGAAQIFVGQVSGKTPTGTMGAIQQVEKADQQLTHAGGLSAFGDYLVVPAEAACEPSDRVLNRCKLASKVYFYDMCVPSAPKKLPYVVDRPNLAGGGAALTRDADGSFVLAVAQTDCTMIDFYHSTGTSLDTDPGFKLFATWSSSSLLVEAGQDSYFGDYQNINFLRESGGGLYMVGFYRSMKGLGSDYADLFQVFLGGGKVTIKKVGSKQFSCATMSCNFEAGAGLYIESPSVLLVYAVNWEPKNRVVMINEFRGGR